MGEAFKIVNCLNILNRLCDRRNARTGHNFFSIVSIGTKTAFIVYSAGKEDMKEN